MQVSRRSCADKLYVIQPCSWPLTWKLGRAPALMYCDCTLQGLQLPLTLCWVADQRITSLSYAVSACAGELSSRND